MNKRLSYGLSYGPAPANVAAPQPLGFGSIGQFSRPSSSQLASFGLPTGNGGGNGSMPGTSGLSSIPTTAGQLGGGLDTSLKAGMFGPVDQFSPANIGNAGAAATPGGGLFGDFFGADGFNMGDLGEISKIIGGFGNLYMGMQQNKLAKKSLDVQKTAYKSNLENQIASFNLALEDRMKARYAQKNQSPEEAQAAIDRHKL